MKILDRQIKWWVVAGMLALASAGAPAAHAVSNKDMEQAKATTALWYLRYVNNGSDYLEKLNPEDLASLKKSLKTKEQENIKAFEAVKTPTDYASWDKDKLVEYWSVTFFNSKGLDDKGRAAKSRVRKKLQQMQVSAPSADAPAPAPEEAAPQLPESAPQAGDTLSQQPALPTGEEVMNDVSALEDSLALAGVPEEEGAKSKKDSGNSATWIYVIALLVLVGVVVWLVIFASKTMQNRPAVEDEDSDQESRRERRSSRKREDEEEVEEIVRVASPGISQESGLREKFARSLAAKEEEIRGLNREVHDLREECLKLGEENGRLSSDLSMTQRELEALRGRLKAASAVTSASSAAGRQAAADAPTAGRQAAAEAAPRQGGSAAESAPREASEIFLGRVNSKGLFVRADRQPVEGKSMYVLITQDGFTGSFRLLQKPYVIETALENPRHYLSGGCVAIDLDDTAGVTAIRTLSAGTAVFEEGCWRVLRKSKIAYE